MAAAIDRELGIQAELVRGRGGVFDVEVDGALLFSKFETERFPEPEEILSPLREQAAGSRL